ncbi:DUF7168 domain-containing protein [Nocardia wallacei]|uniref:DUF7168 domain-containing protein n=1 Tax=Nocardia wallacei TaxID=480035 RepID=UPI00245703FB|nr:hypothetical protein [Nocardia wallacei]
MATERSREKMAERIGLLFNHADHAATEHEAEAFRAKALHLVATTGIEESEARGTRQEGNNAVVALTFHLRGQYLPQQVYLLGVLAAALHCSCVRTRRDHRRQEIKVYGVKLHADRVQLLFLQLNPRMAAAAMKLHPTPDYQRGTRAYRVDWMLGFATRIHEMLSGAEHTAAEARDAETGTTTQALVLLSDAARADAAANRQHPEATQSAYRRRPTQSPYARGRAAAEHVDLSNRTSLADRRRQLGR